MAILLNGTHPEMRILVPETGAWLEFHGGKLEIEEGDPGYEAAMREAASNPSIVVYASVTTCPHCGEPFAGQAAKAQLGKHVKANHFDKWLAESDAKAAEARNVELKSREGFPCDQCPHQTFGTAEDLAAHVKVMHTQAPPMDDEGNVQGDGKAAASTEVPAAKAKKS